MTSRPHIEFIQALELELEPITEGPFAGAHESLLSLDDMTAAYTSIVSMPADWSANLGGYDRPVELFALRGECTVAGRPFRAGCYAYLAVTEARRKLETEFGADLLVMVEAPGRASGESLEIVDTNQLRWVASSLAAVPPGLVNKRLRQDPQTGDRTWLAACAPGWMEERAELHPTVEESLMLGGDLLLGRRGVMTAGCYFWRPPMVPHGPMCTRTGAQFFFRTKGGTLAVDYQTVPGWDRLVADYRSERPLYEGWPER